MDLSLAQIVNFTNPDKTRYSYTEAGIFLQDNLVVNQKLTLDFGLRYDYDGVGKENNISPRISFLLAPLKNKRTIIRGGIGLFYDRTLPIAGFFENLPDSDSLNGIPQRTVSIYGADGTTLLNSRQFTNVTDDNLKTPRSIRWSFHLGSGNYQRFDYSAGLSRKNCEKRFIDRTV